MNKWITGLLCAVLLMAAVPIGRVQAEEKWIEDPVLERLIKQQLKVEGQELTKEDLLKLTTLYPRQMKEKVKSLKGLENALNLTGLYLPGQQVRDLTPLSNLYALTSLSLDGNEIEDVCPLRSLWNLERLDLSHNGITSIDCLAGLTEINSLVLDGNRISDVTAVAHMPLEWLRLADNDIADLSPLADQKRLRHLWIPNNKIISLRPLHAVHSLDSIMIYSSPLDEESLQWLKRIEKMGVRVNRLLEQLETDPIMVKLDGVPLYFDPGAKLSDGSTMVPFRQLFEKLGLAVKWEEESQTITGRKEGVTLSLQIGSTEATVNGKKKALSAPPKLIGEHTYVPVRFISEALQYDVQWDEEELIVAIHTQPRQIWSLNGKGNVEVPRSYVEPPGSYDHYVDVFLRSGSSYLVLLTEYPEAGSPLNDLQTYFNALRKAMVEKGAVFTEEPKKITINGLKGIEAIYANPSARGTLAGRVVLLRGEDDYYRLAFSTEENRFKEGSEEFNRIVRTFRETPRPEELHDKRFGGMTADERLADAVAYYTSAGYFKEKRNDGKSWTSALEEWYAEDYKGSDFDLFDPQSGYGLFADLYLLKNDKARARLKDTEADVADGNQVYVETLKEWAAISRGAFQPTDIKEIWRTEYGPVILEFQLNGEKITLYPQYMNDFMDVNILGKINELIRNTGYQFEMVILDQNVLVTVLTQEEKKRLEEDRLLPFTVFE